MKDASEDCLTLDIVRPSGVVNKDGLPVYVFIHGYVSPNSGRIWTDDVGRGDFNAGDKSEYDGRALVKTSLQLGSPIMYVAMHYRLSFLGFPNSGEVVEHNATNLGLLDQRLALDWLKSNIRSFGGDPNKVNF